MQKFLGWVGLLVILIAMAGIYDGYVKYGMWKGGFENKPEYTAARKEDISTKAEYDLFLVAKAKAEVAEAKAEDERREKSCVYNWKACEDNEDLVNNYEKYSEIPDACRVRAMGLAKYDTSWGLSWFTTYYEGDTYIVDGNVTLVERGAKFENGFGAKKSVNLKCYYSLEQSAVTTVVLF
tara:strand:- start:165 stop:704 length:540 start_codon:yes stop_codon:yes gene_type:complete